MKIPCSNCNQRLEIPEELAGQTIECPACNESLDVPAMAAKPPAPIQQSAPQVAASEKPKSSKLKLAIAAVAGTAVVVIASIMFFSDTKIEPVTEVAQTEHPKVIAPEITIQETAKTGNIEAVKQHLEGNMMMPYGMGNMPTMGMNPMMGMPGTGFGVPKDFDPKEIFKQEIEEINQRLLKGELLNQYNDQGDTELMVAARANDLDLAKRLLGKKLILI
ncbi:zinc-ribbon domain-containing protein [bacterium]|nr:zinc-ribbon domain-containing protein [bacterium]